MATGDPFTAAVKQHGKTKRSSRRQLLIAGAGAVLLVVFLMRRRSSTAQAAVPAAVDATALPPAAGSGIPSTFADNGAQAATLGDNVTNSLSGLQTSLDSQTSAFQGLADQIGQSQAAANAAALTAQVGPAGPPGPAGPAWDPAAAFAYVAAHPPNTPSGNIGQPATAAHVNSQAGNPRAGQSYTTQPAKGGVYHVYASGKKIFVKK